ncbi:ABC transporter C family member 2 isoform X3 [Populus alba x Populus x berolinensis]|nr:ABC transporter C family member 2 isoform X3 [Populus alba x Populus x berolinensis]
MGFEALDWYCKPVRDGVWTKAVENAFGAYTPCATDTLVVSLSYLVLMALCFYKIWLTKKDFKLQRFCLRSKWYAYLLALLALYSTAEPLYRLVMGISVLNLDGQTGLAPFEIVSLIIEALAWCSLLVMIVVEIKVYIREFRWFVRFGLIYTLVGDAVMLNLILTVKEFYNNAVLHLYISEVIVQTFVISRMQKLSKEGLQRTDKRIGLMNEILAAMDTVKCYAWESSFQAKVQGVRDDELSWFRKASLLGAVLSSFFIVSLIVLLTAEILLMVVNANVSLKRLEELFLAEERILLPKPLLDPWLPAVSIKNGYFSWDSKAERHTLSNINLDVPIGSLVAVVGSAGEGKTSLVSAMLGELPATSDASVVIRGTVAYVPQVSCIFNATVRNNILFGSPFDSARYEKAIDVTALQHDLDLLPSGDLTGERGVDINGGQKQRVFMARAVYSNLDVYIFYDPLSALDAHVGRQPAVLLECGLVDSHCTAEKLMGNAGKMEEYEEQENNEIVDNKTSSKQVANGVMNNLPKNVSGTKKPKEGKSVLIKQEERETCVVNLKVLTRTKDKILLVCSMILAPMFILISLMQSTTREVKRLDSITISPVYAQFGESLNGLSTIRAYKAYDRMASINGKSMDNNVRYTLVNMGANRWLAIRLETLGGIMIWFTATFAVMQNGRADNQQAFASTMGLLLSYALNITSLLTAVLRLASLAENSLNSVERVGTYIELPSEAPLVIESNCPPPRWPSSGAIKFEDVVLRYRPEPPPVLHGLSFTIFPSDKVGIVGRTGAGKSSMLNALFRIVELERGRILIDDCDIAKFGLMDLRKVLGIIPQSPVLFSGTVRFNRDPFSEHNDVDLSGIPWD